MRRSFEGTGSEGARVAKRAAGRRAAGKRAAAALAAAALLTGAAACAANPGPPPLASQGDADGYAEKAETSTEETTTTTPPKGAERSKERVQVQVGIDPVRNGFNPHLQADEQAAVASIADLVLPSAFVNGERNPDLLVAASQLATSPEAMTVRYVINPQAQWSDGAPINGADFIYLWRAMRSTPGTVDPAGYDAIANIRVSGPTGRTVDVDFRSPVRGWRELFQYLLPSHLLSADGSDFASALQFSIPASAGRFLFSGVDTSRGAVTLNRNDRFWGPRPASIDILELQYVRNTTQLADQLRSRQLAYADVTPDETTLRVLDLVPNSQIRVDAGPRTLGITAVADVPRRARQELFSLIDAPLIASIATGRSANVNPANELTNADTANQAQAAETAAAAGPGAAKTSAGTAGTGTGVTADGAAGTTGFQTTTPGSEGAADGLAGYVAKHGTLRIAADPSDPAAYAAARSVADLLTGRGTPATVVATDTVTLMSKALPSNEVDAVVGWRLRSGNTTAVAGRAACPPHAFRAANISGFCSAETESLASDVLSGAVSATDADATLAGIEAREALWMPIVNETRVAALGAGIVGPDPRLDRWDGGLETAPTWHVTPLATPTATPTKKD